MARLAGRIARLIVALLALALAIPAAGLAYGWLTTAALEATPPNEADGAPTEALRAEAAAGIEAYRRPEEATYLTYPEWAIVYAARDYAGFVAEADESGFAYWAYIGRFWQDYATVIRATADYPFNAGNHVMLLVIGTSHTVEHAIQWAWENTLGRLSAVAAGGRKTAQDRFLAAMAADYAAFLDQVPWYRFAYDERRAALWRTETAPGLAALRSWERRLAFGLALSIKQAYAGLITAGLGATYDPALTDINVWAAGPVASAISGEADTRLQKDLGDHGAVFVTRRYQVFTEMIPRLIASGVRFVEIGGNDDILVTVVSNDEIAVPAGARAIFAYQLPARPAVRRTGLAVPVRRLHAILPALAAAGAGLEHVYDY
ncbi:hypothetical protein GN330_07030 [Nitratireductor sp. CAU 1489]|uniref:Uncharacterized protein n=1 Tax=Nitratireductor arenosus TaxID=2682096 RepID=A0A844QGV4_9HYPH|nr:hypothetical protein [Nitratireductor arenosus]MVA96999.1 hypothetical protein [Nitratireductor arenosus]